MKEALQHREHYQTLMAQVQETLTNFPAMWQHLDMDERRQVLSDLLEKLTVDRVGRDAVVRIKTHLLPEQKIPIMFRSAVNMKEKPTGLQSMTPRHLAYLYHVGLGKSRREIAKAMAVNYATATTFSMQIRRRLNTNSDEEGAVLAAERIEVLLPTLPIGPSNAPNHIDRVNSLLTPALMQILPYLAQGASSREIAQRTGLSITTVGGRRARIMDIWGTKSAFEVAERAQALGLL